VDLAIQPDQWNYKADIFTENTECKVISMGGNAVLIVPSAKGGGSKVTMHHIGDGFEAEDDAGDVFERFIQEGGYRVVCSKLPAHFTVEVVFALVRQQRQLNDLMPKSLPNGKQGIGMGIAELKPMDKFDMLDPRPSTYNVIAKGHYNHGAKKCSIQAILNVDNGH
jgi:hypothetical protein